MASGWDVASKSVIRNNGRNAGPTIWDDDAVAGQVIDSAGHDTNDQTLADSITETLNINGINAMLSDLYMSSNKINGLADGAVSSDAVNLGQLQAETAAREAADSALQGEVNTNTSNIAINTADIASLGGNTGALITDQSFDGTTFSSIRPAGNFATAINVFSNLKANGQIRQKLGTSISVNVSTSNRHAVTQSGALTLTFTGLPTDTDSTFGTTYQVEGQVNVWTSTPGTVTISGMAGARIIGEPSTASNSVSILTYIISRVAGTSRLSLVWSS